MSSAAIHFAPPEVQKAWKDALSKLAIVEGKKHLEASRDEIQDTTDAISVFLNGMGSVFTSRTEVLNPARSNLITRLKNRNMIALAYEPPRKVSSQPLFIPQNYWTGDIGWDKAELTFQSLRFIEVRVLSYEMVEALNKKFAAKDEAIREISKPQKGRPTIRPQITKAFEHLHSKGTFDSRMSIKHASEYIRQQLEISYPELNVTEDKPSFEAIRRVISPLIKEVKNNKQ